MTLLPDITGREVWVATIYLDIGAGEIRSTIFGVYSTRAEAEKYLDQEGFIGGIDCSVESHFIGGNE